MKNRYLPFFLLVTFGSQTLCAASIEERLALLSKAGLDEKQNPETKKILPSGSEVPLLNNQPNANNLDSRYLVAETFVQGNQEDSGLMKKGLERITKGVEHVADYAKNELLPQAGEVALQAGEHAKEIAGKAGEQAKEITHQITEQAKETGKHLMSYFLPKIKELFGVVGRKLISWSGNEEILSKEKSLAGDYKNEIQDPGLDVLHEASVSSSLISSDRFESPSESSTSENLESPSESPTSEKPESPSESSASKNSSSQKESIII
ncbi:hypothetical protein HE1_00113 [Holospora elegans E1]|uniref:Uncharacterized protein n=1 Tax=Holospora elegans E1 TaxID=1427503 RepID=A0A023DWR0_9PROT|nr:hypothetical protein [Holospora elegans]GAJ45804.1 hypothetical protein HE1_00113 [Holospora elegans E1]